ncbi:biopolymer transporter ExbD [Bacteroidales bacterium OttesenSCG-928-I14]|nr:biopolymer transporter ExbD [Bacteroidales bacterium OttesenSCG-928-I14]
MGKSRRKIPQINSSSSADIAFLLLIFFLITSSIQSNLGIYRRLTPVEAQELIKEKSQIEDRNLLVFQLDSLSKIRYEEDEFPIYNVKELSKAFIISSDTINHVISLEIDRRARYENYIALLNELTTAYNELRNEIAKEKYGSHLSSLDSEKYEEIREMLPMRISEKEINISEKE